MAHYDYLLQSLKDKNYYIGETFDVPARFLFHNAGKQRSTKNKIPFTNILFEEYENRILVLKLQKQKISVFTEIFCCNTTQL